MSTNILRSTCTQIRFKAEISVLEEQLKYSVLIETNRELTVHSGMIYNLCNSYEIFLLFLVVNNSIWMCGFLVVGFGVVFF